MVVYFVQKHLGRRIIAIISILFPFILQENIFPKNLEEIKIHYQVRPPYFIQKEDSNKLKEGELYQKISLILKDAKIKYKYIHSPLEKSYSDISKNKDKICLGYKILSNDKKEVGYYSLPFYIDKQNVILHRSDDNRFEENKTLNDYLSDFDLLLLIKLNYSYGEYEDSMIDSIKKHEINHMNDQNEGNTGFRLTYTDNFSMMKQIENNRADYMIISQNEFEYFEKISSENKLKLTFKKLKDITTGNKRSLFCSKKVTRSEMDKINKSILKLVGIL